MSTLSKEEISKLDDGFEKYFEDFKRRPTKNKASMLLASGGKDRENKTGLFSQEGNSLRSKMFRLKYEVLGDKWSPGISDRVKLASKEDKDLDDFLKNKAKMLIATLLVNENDQEAYDEICLNLSKIKNAFNTKINKLSDSEVHDLLYTNFTKTKCIKAK
jgi:hypothetical protein